jgi:hypothetical protein
VRTRASTSISVHVAPRFSARPSSSSHATGIATPPRCRGENGATAVAPRMLRPTSMKILPGRSAFFMSAV